MQLHYRLVDVFTEVPFGGNQLAVFLNGTGVSGATMQRIAREMNLSETTFVLPPETPDTHFRLRIFTPAAELPMAGHPTIGSAFVLASDSLFPLSAPECTVVFGEGIGAVPVLIANDGRKPGMVRMVQRPPVFTAPPAGLPALAQALSLSVEDFHEASPLQTVSAGLPFLMARVRSLGSLAAIRLNQTAWEEVFQGAEARGLFIFTTEVERAGSTVHGRMFAPGLSVAEDPATGSAAGPLGGYLVRHGIVPAGNPTRVRIEQGFEMGRPSLLHVEVDGTPEEIAGVRVGGYSVLMGRGQLELDEG